MLALDNFLIEYVFDAEKSQSYRGGLIQKDQGVCKCIMRYSKHCYASDTDLSKGQFSIH